MTVKRSELIAELRDVEAGQRANATSCAALADRIAGLIMQLAAPAHTPAPTEPVVQVIPKPFNGKRFTVPHDGNDCAVCKRPLRKGEPALGNATLRSAAHLACGEEQP